MDTFTNSEDPDEMLHNAAFREGQHCLFRSKIFSDIKYITFVLSPDNPRCVQWFITSVLYQTRRKNPLVYKGFIMLDTGSFVDLGNRRWIFWSVRTDVQTDLNQFCLISSIAHWPYSVAV